MTIQEVLLNKRRGEFGEVQYRNMMRDSHKRNYKMCPLNHQFKMACDAVTCDACKQRENIPMQPRRVERKREK